MRYQRKVIAWNIGGASGAAGRGFGWVHDRSAGVDSSMIAAPHGRARGPPLRTTGTPPPIRMIARSEHSRSKSIAGDSYRNPWSFEASAAMFRRAKNDQRPDPKIEALGKKMLAASYSPTQSPVQYHRRRRA